MIQGEMGGETALFLSAIMADKWMSLSASRVGEGDSSQGLGDISTPVSGAEQTRKYGNYGICREQSQFVNISVYMSTESKTDMNRFAFDPNHSSATVVLHYK